MSGESAVVDRIGANKDPFGDVDEARELTALVDELYRFTRFSTRICHR